MIALEETRITISYGRVAYSLEQSTLPFALTFAQRHEVVPMSERSPTFGTQSDGKTSGNDGSGGDSEEFDWLDDD